MEESTRIWPWPWLLMVVLLAPQPRFQAQPSRQPKLQQILDHVRVGVILGGRLTDTLGNGGAPIRIGGSVLVVLSATMTMNGPQQILPPRHLDRVRIGVLMITRLTDTLGN